MSKNKADKGVLKTSLADLLAGKNITSPSMANNDTLIASLENEKMLLELEIDELTTEIKLLKTEISFFSNLPEELSARAVAELKAENYIDAMGLLLAVLVIHPGHRKAMLNLSVAYAGLGFTSKSLETLEAVLIVDPENEKAIRNIGILKQGAL